MRRSFGLRDVGAVIDDAIALYRADFRHIATLSVAILLPGLLLASVSGAVYYARSITFFFDPGGFLDPTSAAPAQTLGLTVLTFLLWVAVPIRFLADLVVRSSLFRTTPALMTGERPEFRELLRKAWPRLLMLVAITLVVQIAVQFGLVFLVVPGVIAAVRLSLAGPIAVMEDSTFDGALRRSWSLTEGHFWRTVLFLGGVAGVVLAVRASVAAPASLFLVQPAMAVFQDPETLFGVTPVWVSVLLGVAGSLGGALVVPLDALARAQYYLDLRARREGMDLLMRARRIAADRS